MDITGATALVTGAGRGLGRHFVEELLERGARRVYATARSLPSLEGLRDDPRVETIRLDITDPEQVADAAARAGDVDLLINNAGIATLQNLVTGDLDAIRAEMDTHFFGTLAMTRAFAPVLERNGGGAIVNVMSLLSFRVHPGNGAYAAAKAAEWQLTNSTRLELASQGTRVVGVHLSSTDTDMMAGWDIPKNHPRAAVALALDALAAGRAEALDGETAEVKAQLHRAPEELYAPFRSPSAP
ncbi:MULTISPECIES: SDR family oxidoreductase [unclassified Rathayibacter]|uniref:SDR family oxidoreductase n=1 Tax=unclassified Rathayibacter TaxID=2609250 RepID=UPI0006FDB9F0|nr:MULTISPECIES: SDR family oxidoreductase [unclassified Rathayibacter]KQQ03562.1 short-chain dehydrogenase [Rathayibacter sp. Leaf294]KQS12018.1 short-chain dehydrogenase [Rathayibacter sp. Leaf185]